MTEEIIFNCGICNRQIDVSSDKASKILEKQMPPAGSGSDLVTYRIESRCKEDEVHLNVIIVDSQGKYRGIKHSEIKTSKQIDEASLNSLKEALRFGNDFSKAISLSLRGYGLVICGEEEECRTVAHVLSKCFALESYDIKPWISSIGEFVKLYGKTADISTGTIILTDSGLVRQVIQTLEKTPRMELRNRTVYNTEATGFSSNLLKMLRSVPDGENRAMRVLVNSNLDSLQSNLSMLESMLRERLTDIMVLKAGNLTEVPFINQVLEQLLSPEELNTLRGQIKPDELEILAPHLIRRIPGLSRAIAK